MLLFKSSHIVKNAGEVGKKHKAVNIPPVDPPLRLHQHEGSRINSYACGVQNAVPEMVFLIPENGKTVPHEGMAAKKNAGRIDLLLSFRIETRRSDRTGYFSRQLFCFPVIVTHLAASPR